MIQANQLPPSISDRSISVKEIDLSEIEGGMQTVKEGNELTKEAELAK
ncbi:hypothetical protein U0X36_05385 [Bacillus thuringiensis]|nr:hypothetical protein [Bacillus thuringiensis]MDZ3952377.1 hypothetical protein [Bacillus thuringiensis]